MTRDGRTKILPPYLVILCMLGMYTLDRYLPVVSLHVPAVISWLVMFLALLCLFYSAYLFHQHRTNIKPFEEPRFLIQSWPYNWSRNPIYLFMIVFLAGWGLWLQSVSCFLVVLLFSVWLHFRFVLPEEQLLKKIFGDAYFDYKSSVRRWL